MPHPQALTEARTAKLCADLREWRLRAASRPGGEYGIEGVHTMAIGLEHVLHLLVQDLGGSEAMRQMAAALAADITPEQLADYKAQRSQAQARHQAAGPDKDTTLAHYQRLAAQAEAAGARA